MRRLCTLLIAFTALALSASAQSTADQKRTDYRLVDVAHHEDRTALALSDMLNEVAAEIAAVGYIQGPAHAAQASAHSEQLAPIPHCDEYRIDFRQYMPQAQTVSQCDVGRPCFQNHFASASVVFLSRDADNFQVSFDFGGGESRSVNLNHGFTPGIEATLAYRTGSAGYLELTYLGINEWSSDNRTDDVPFGGGPSRLSSIDDYTANLNDIQLNLVAMDPFANWDWLVGFRVVDQRDEAESILTLDNGLGGAAVSERVFAEAGNTLFGFHGGTRYGRSFGSLTFDAGAKVGIFHNATSQDGSVFAGGISIDGIPEATSDTDGGEVSWMGDFMARMNYRVTGRSQIHIGYRGLIFSDIVQSTNRNGAPADPSGIAYHGIVAGLSLYR